MHPLIILGIIILSFVLLVLFLLLPGNKNRVIKHEWLYKNLIAHRGIHNNTLGIMENSKTAFIKAIEKKYNIETDIFLTKDEKLIVFHDDNFSRLFNVSRKACEMNLEEIKQLNYKNSTDKILEFNEFLEIINGQTGLVLELKSQNNVKDKILCDKVMQLLKTYRGNYVIQSFNPILLRYLKKKYPLVPRGQLYTKFNLKEENKKMKGQGFKKVITLVSMFCYNLKLSNLLSRPHYIDEDYKLLDFMTTICHLFMPLVIYTVDNAKYFEHFIKSKKVDNIIFENIEIDKYGRTKNIIS